jgi:hypothetical protein
MGVRALGFLGGSEGLLRMGLGVGLDGWLRGLALGLSFGALGLSFGVLALSLRCVLLRGYTISRRTLLPTWVTLGG